LITDAGSVGRTVRASVETCLSTVKPTTGFLAMEEGSTGGSDDECEVTEEMLAFLLKFDRWLRTREAGVDELGTGFCVCWRRFAPSPEDLADRKNDLWVIEGWI
jgi:hypothetical protein